MKKVDYWQDFPEPGTGTILDVLQIGLIRFAGVLEVKRETNGDYEMVAYLVNKKLCEPLKTFKIKAKRDEFVDGGEFNTERLKREVWSMLSEALAGVDIKTATGIVDDKTNEWVDAIKGNKRELVEEIVRNVSLQAVCDKVKLEPGIRTSIRVVKRGKKTVH